MYKMTPEKLYTKDNDYYMVKIVKFDFTVICNIVKYKQNHAENQLFMVLLLLCSK